MIRLVAEAIVGGHACGAYESELSGSLDFQLFLWVSKPEPQHGNLPWKQQF